MKKKVKFRKYDLWELERIPDIPFYELKNGDLLVISKLKILKEDFRVFLIETEIKLNEQMQNFQNFLQTVHYERLINGSWKPCKHDGSLILFEN